MLVDEVWRPVPADENDCWPESKLQLCLHMRLTDGQTMAGH